MKAKIKIQPKPSQIQARESNRKPTEIVGKASQPKPAEASQPYRPEPLRDAGAPQETRSGPAGCCLPFDAP